MPGADDLFPSGGWTDGPKLTDAEQAKPRRRNPSDVWFAPVVFIGKVSTSGRRQVVVFSSDEFRVRFPEHTSAEFHEVDALFDSGKRAVRIIALTRT